MMIMDESKIKKLTEKGESETVELKPSLSQINEIVESVSAFANCSGGKILVGVSNSGKVLGVDVGKDTIERLANKITGNTEPKVYPKISVEGIEGKKIIVVDVKKSEETVLAFGRPFKRVGKSTVRMGREEYEKSVIEKKKVYWDYQICEGATIEDVNKEKVRWFLKEAKRERGLDIQESISVKEILLRLKLMRDEKPTNACILLFGRSPQDFFPFAETKCIRFKGKDVSEPMLDMKIVSGNIIDQVKEAEKFIFDHINLESWIEEGKIERQEKWEYPPKAIRESIVNALCHRDYVSQSSSQVRVFDDRMEFWNPGALPRGWTVETLKNPHESKPPNPLLAKQLFWIKYAEDVGTGTNKIIKWCAEWELPEPIFEFTGTSIVVRLRKPIALEELSRIGLNERQIKAVEYVGKKGSIANKEFQKLNNTTRYTAERDLSGLVKKGVFIRTGRGKRGIRYLLPLQQDAAKMRQKKRQKNNFLARKICS